MSRTGEGIFEKHLGANVKIEWYDYNAGPSAMEAIFAKSIDLTYVGPNPAINAFAKSKGKEIRIISGSANGGSALIVKKSLAQIEPKDFKGKRIATPQLGNTQDVATRAWLASHGIRTTLSGGDATVVPTANPDQLALFIRGDLDAVWTVEPWVSRLEREAEGVRYLSQNNAITTVVAARVAFLKERPQLVANFISAHTAVTEWINAHPKEAQARVDAELIKLTKQKSNLPLIAHAWQHITFTTQLDQTQLRNFVDDARKAGLLKHDIDVKLLASGKP